MDKKISDYLNLYLPFEFDFFGYKYKVIGFKDNGNFFHFWHEHGFFDVQKEDFKLPLRNLSDMTDAEWTELNKVMDKWIPFRESTEGKAAEVKYLLSKHFDLFGLIEAGLAIDAKMKDIENNWDDYCTAAAE